MPTCVWCNRSGWLLEVGRDGLCNGCGANLRPEIETLIAALQRALNRVGKRGKPADAAGAIAEAIDLCDRLAEFERKRVATTQRPPSQLAAEFRGNLEGYLGAIGRELLAEARLKSARAATDAARLRPFADALAALQDLAAKFPSHAAVAAAVLEAQRAFDRAQFSNALRKAEIAQAQGKNKAAADALIAAMVGLRHDATDDAEQAELFAAARRLLRSLGAEPPF